jgi:uncharacterized protein YecT (DUF1311 family)
MHKVPPQRTAREEMTRRAFIWKRSLLCTLFVVSTVAAAGEVQSADQLQLCMKTAMTQRAMDECAGQEATRADREMHHVYRSLLSKAEHDPIAVAKIRQAERTWLAFRAAYLAAMWPTKDKQAAYGTVYPMEADLIYAKLTWRQASALQALLNQYSPNGGPPDLYGGLK